MLSIVCLWFCFVEFCSTWYTKSCYLVLIGINARFCSIFGAGKSRNNIAFEVENVGKDITFDDFPSKVNIAKTLYKGNSTPKSKYKRKI